MCLDRNAVKKLVYAGTGSSTWGPYPPGSYAYKPEPGYPYDPEKAKSMFAKAGAAGLQFGIEVPAGYPTLSQTATIWQAGPFDAILLDAPCSSTGTIRRHPDVPWLKSEADFPALLNLQRALLDHAISLLKSGGLLVYCTCSLEPEENEHAVKALLERDPTLRRRPVAAAEVGGLAELLNSDGDLRTLPCHLADSDARKSGLDGFYAARIEKKG